MDQSEIVSGPDGNPVGAVVPGTDGEWLAFPTNPNGPGYGAPVRGATRAEVVAAIGGESEAAEAASDIGLAWWHLDTWCEQYEVDNDAAYALERFIAYLWDEDMRALEAIKVLTLAMVRYARTKDHLKGDAGDSDLWQVRDTTAQRHASLSGLETAAWSAPERDTPRAALCAGLLHIYASAQGGSDPRNAFLQSLSLYAEVHAHVYGNP